MKNQSIWKNHIQKAQNKFLDHNLETDILIIGGGIAGLTTAYFLKDTDYKITLIDRKNCGLGITSNSSAKVSFVQEDIYHKMNKKIASKYLHSQIEAIKIVKEIVKKHQIACELTKSPTYLFTEQEEKIKELEKEQIFYKENHISYTITDKLPIHFPCKYALKIEDSYVFNPLKYSQALKKIVHNKITIYENTTALSINKNNNNYEVITPTNHIQAKIVIVCTHYPFFTIPLLIPFKTTIEKSFLIASTIKENLNFNAINTGNPTHSLRTITFNHHHYLLYVTNSHLISKYHNKEKYYQDSIMNQNKYINHNIYSYFTNQDILTPDHLPYIGLVKENLYVATGFNTWGMTNGTISGKILSDMILNKPNTYIELFNPKRIPYNLTNLIIYNLNNSSSYILSKMKTNYSFYQEKVKVIKENNQKIGIYIDELGNEHKVLNTCPHLKCNLVFNMQEKTWDCPCHGSRFDIHGNSICGPSCYNIKYPNESSIQNK